MKETITLSGFRDAFQIRKENFSYHGLEALFNYIEEIEEESDTETELDVIALCCEFAEYDNLAEFQNAYGDEYKTLEDISDATAVIEIEGKEAFIIQDF